MTSSLLFYMDDLPQNGALQRTLMTVLDVLNTDVETDKYQMNEKGIKLKYENFKKEN